MTGSQLPIPMTVERRRRIEATRFRNASIDAVLAAKAPHQELMIALSKLREVGCLDPAGNLHQLLDRFDARGGCRCAGCVDQRASGR